MKQLEPEDIVASLSGLTDSEVGYVMREACYEYELRKSEGSAVSRANAYMQIKYGNHGDVPDDAKAKLP